MHAAKAESGMKKYLQTVDLISRCEGCQFPSCAKCTQLRDEERILHSREECACLESLGHGKAINDFEKNTSLVYACIWIYRAFRWKQNNPDYFNYISRYLMSGRDHCRTCNSCK